MTPPPAGLIALFLVAGCTVDHSGLGTLLDTGPAMDAPSGGCALGAQRTCGSAIGECQLGQQNCVDGVWSECVGAVGPSAEMCDEAMQDEDCDGMANEDCACIPGSEQASDEGACLLGRSECLPEAAWGACQGAITPIDEECDGVDNDCDRRIDEGVLRTFFIDGDGDGAGSDRMTAEGCEVPDGFVDNATDCNDFSAEEAPDNTEVCDGIDNNCDGQIDEGLLIATYYRDGDGDGFGVDDTIMACGPGDGYVDQLGDCDDAAMNIHPGAAEHCDLIDSDCDDVVDESCDEGCTTASYNGHFYLFCRVARSWHDARNRCAIHGRYDLVSVEDREEQRWIDDTGDGLQNDRRWWIGYTDQAQEDRFVWSNGSSATYSRWGRREPNDAGDGEDCVETGKDDDEWNDSACGIAQFYICEELD